MDKLYSTRDLILPELTARKMNKSFTSGHLYGNQNAILEYPLGRNTTKDVSIEPHSSVATTQTWLLNATCWSRNRRHNRAAQEPGCSLTVTWFRNVRIRRNSFRTRDNYQMFQIIKSFTLKDEDIRIIVLTV